MKHKLNLNEPGGRLFGIALVLPVRRSLFAILAAAVSGSIMFFEFVEVLVIGSPAGVAQNLQIFYFGVGTLIVAVSFGAWFLQLLNEEENG